MHYRFGNAKEHQADPHPCRKKHRKPGVVAEIRLRMVRAQLDITVA
ncbi:Uncharacterised protein [Klebsiella pneumoniae]|nr:Uncharacterised protein [Klebsiella pneumoniae]